MRAATVDTIMMTIIRSSIFQLLFAVFPSAMILQTLLLDEAFSANITFILTFILLISFNLQLLRPQIRVLLSEVLIQVSLSRVALPTFIALYEITSRIF